MQRRRRSSLLRRARCHHHEHRGHSTGHGASLSAGEFRWCLWAANSPPTSWRRSTRPPRRAGPIPVGLRPTALAVAKEAGKVYVADRQRHRVVISKATMTRSGTIALPAPSGRKPDQISVSRTGASSTSPSPARTSSTSLTPLRQDLARFSTGWRAAERAPSCPIRAGRSCMP